MQQRRLFFSIGNGKFDLYKTETPELIAKMVKLITLPYSRFGANLSLWANVWNVTLCEIFIYLYTCMFDQTGHDGFWREIPQ